MLILAFNEIMDQIAMANNVNWYSHMLTRIVMFWGALCFEIDCQRRQRVIWKKPFEVQCMKVCLNREDALCQSI